MALQNLATILSDRAGKNTAEIARATDVATRTGLGLAHVVVRSGLCDARQLTALLADATGIRVFDPIADRPLVTAVRRLPHKLAMRRRALVVRARADGGWVVAFSDPTDRITRGAVQNLLGGQIEPLLIDEITLEQGIAHFYGPGAEEETAAADLRPQETAVNLAGMLLEDDGDDSFLTESTDDALQTYMEPMARQGVGADDGDLAWLRARAMGEMDVPQTVPMERAPGIDGRPGDSGAFEARSTDVIVGVLDDTAQSPPPQMPASSSGPSPPSPHRPSTMVDALGGRTEEGVRASVIDQAPDAPTMVDDRAPLADPSSKQGDGQ